MKVIPKFIALFYMILKKKSFRNKNIESRNENGLEKQSPTSRREAGAKEGQIQYSEAEGWSSVGCDRGQSLLWGISEPKFKGTFVSPTLVAGAGILKIGEGTAFSYQADKTREIWTDLLQNVAKIYQAGIPLTLATDAGTPFNGFELTAVEFQLFVEKNSLNAFPSSTNILSFCAINED